jgi:hypothetical protein
MTPWTNQDIRFDWIDYREARKDELLMAQVAAASLVESGSDLYTANLVEYFQGDEEVAEWLTTEWEPEELQHGAALRAYTEKVWPDLCWPELFEAFLKDYRALCQIEALRPTRGLELASRCVVETGTATLYWTLHERAREPVLRDIVNRIRQDEVRHFKNFYRFFRKYQRSEKLGRARVARTLIDRVAEVRREDADCALAHIFRARYPGKAGDRAALEHWKREVFAQAKHQYPFEMATKMLLTPLELHPRIKPWIGTPVAFAARMVMWGL